MKLHTSPYYPEIFSFEEDSDYDEKSNSLSETIKVGAFVESVSRKEHHEAAESEADVPFSKLLKAAAPLGGMKKRVESSPPPASNPQPPPPSDQANEDSDNGNLTNRSLSHEDFIMVDLKTPFAGSNANTELGVFYRECQSAPPLEAFSTEPTVGEQVGDLTSQLEAFEVSLEEYDNVITELYASENNN